MAAHAASLTTAGAGKSGKPCDRLTPPWRSLSRVISRMTDSVNCVAFFDPVSVDIILFLAAPHIFHGAGGPPPARLLSAFALRNGSRLFARCRLARCALTR